MNALAHHPALARRAETGPHLCQLVSDWHGKMPTGGVIIEPKIDGVRALWINSELVTREGVPIDGCLHITRELEQLERWYGKPMFFDGELLVGGTFDATLSHLRTKGDRQDAGTLHLFDACPMRGWRGEVPTMPLTARRTELANHVKHLASGAVKMLPAKLCQSPLAIEAEARQVIAAGGEGIVIKAARAPYFRTRTASWQRIKKVLTADIRIVAVVPQNGRTDRLGALLCDHDGVVVRVSQGFDDMQRARLWNDRDTLIGQIVEVEAMEKTARGSLRQARFTRFREDKTA